MSEQNPLETIEETKPSELDLLKARAKMIGLTFSNNISVETLREKIRAKVDGVEETSDQAQVGVNALTMQDNPTTATPTPTLRQYMINEPIIYTQPTVGDFYIGFINLF